ncbi:MAG: hypothetical protein K8J31_00955 [Anaerolineae bacterium]|nr:hypothetical protein [Anaerolineae bacterium]
MLTWQLWRALTHPPRHNPLFERILHSGLNHRNRFLRTLQVAAVYVCACVLISLIWPLWMINAGLVTVLMAAAGNTIHSMVWASTISSAIARERDQDTYDLLCMLPTGALGAGWTLSTAHLHRSPIFRALRIVVHNLAMAIVGAFLTTMLIPALMILAPGSPAVWGLFLLLVYGVTLAAAAYLDYIQSLTLASLIGMIVPSYALDRINAQLWSTAGFLLIRLTLYLAALIAGFIIVPELLNGFGPQNPAVQISLPLLRLAIFYGLHEAAIAWAWHILKQQFSAHPSDLEKIL